MIRTARQDHEIGLHAWDHHAWQARIERMDGCGHPDHLRAGWIASTTSPGQPPACSAVPAWKCTTQSWWKKIASPLPTTAIAGGQRFFPVVNGRADPAPDSRHPADL